MKKSKTTAIKESEALRTIVLGFIEAHIQHFKPIYHNLDRIIFLKDLGQDKPLDVFTVSGMVRLMLPDHRYILVAGESFNDLTHAQRKREVIHALCHIPASFSGEILRHDHEGFSKEITIQEKQDQRVYHMNKDAFAEPDLKGNARPRSGNPFDDIFTQINKRGR